MLETCDIRIFLLILSLSTSIKSTKVFSDQKKCGDPECETSMSRVLAIKDYRGPDCRYLNFKAGEEIMVHFKLSGKREDLWAGSKGADFGYFPKDAVQTEEVFIIKEVEVPTKETDFLCLDGEEYVFENEGSILNNHDEENEYLHLHTEVFPKEHKEPFPVIDGSEDKSKDLHILESTSHDDSELRDSKMGQAETIQQEDQNSQTLKHLPTQSSWAISGFADWFGLERKENEEASGKISETAKEVTFRHRKTTMMDDSDLKELDEGDTEPRTSSWFKSTFTDLLHFGSEKSGLGLLYKESDPEILDNSAMSGTVDHDTTAVSETTEEHSNSEQPKSNWFDLELSDVLAFGYSKGNKVKEKPPDREERDQNEEPLPPSTQTSSMHEDLRKQTVETITSGEKEKYEETAKQIAEATLQNEQEKYHQEAPETDITKGNEHIDLDAEAPSFYTEPFDKIVKLFAEQDSESRDQVMENINVKAVTKESERTNDQSGWYESLYSSVIDFKRATADNQPAHESIGIQSSQESTEDQLQGLDPIHTQSTREKNHEVSPKHQPFLSISYFTDVLNFQGLISKENINVPHVEKELKFSKESTQSKSSDEILHINKESKEQLLLNQNSIDKVSENKDIDTSQESIVVCSSATESIEKIREKTQDDELGKYKIPHLLPVKSKSRLSNGQCIQIHWNRTSESLEIQNHSNTNTKEKNMGHIWEVEKDSPLLLGNPVSSPGIYSSVRSTLIKEGSYGGEAIQNKNEYMKNSHLKDTEMYPERRLKGEMKMDDEVESSLATQKQEFFSDLKEHSDNFAQSRDVPGEDKILLDASDEDELLIHREKEQILSEIPKVMRSEVQEISKEPDNKSSHIDFTESAFPDQTNKKAQEEGTSQNDRNVAEFSFSSRSSQDTGVSDASHSEVKPSQLEQLPSFFSLSHYKLLLSFQSFTDKDKNYLQGVQEDRSSKDKDSQPRSSVVFVRNEETEEKKQLYQKMEEETNMKVDFSNKDISLPSSAMQDNGDSENIMEDAKLLTDTSASSEKYFLDYTMDSLFRNQKPKVKGPEDKECINIKGISQSFSGEQHDTPELTFNIQISSQQYKIIKTGFLSSNPNCNDDNSLLSLQKDCVTDSYEKREVAEVRSTESVSPDGMKDYFPLCSNDYDELNKSIVTKEGLNNFSQEKAKEKIVISEHLTDNEKSKLHGEDTENESNQPTSEEDSNMLNQQGLSMEATSQGVFQSEKETDGLASHISSYNSVNVKKNPQDPQVQTEGKSSEEKQGSMTDRYFDIGQHSDSSLTEEVDYGHGPQEKITSSLSSGAFSKESMHFLQRSVGLTYQKEDESEPKSEQIVTSSYVTPQDRESSKIMGLGTDEKRPDQVVCDTKIHLTTDKGVEKLQISVQPKQIDDILNNEGTKSEHQKKTLDVMPKLPGTTSLKVTEDILLTIDGDSLLQKQRIVEGISSGNQPLNLEVQSETFETHNNVNPGKHFSYDIPHHLEALDYKMDHILPPIKDNLDIHHLATDPDDETFVHDRTTLLPKNLKCVEKQGCSEHVKASQEKGQKVVENDKETEHSGRSEKTGRQGVLSNIYGKTSWLFSELFQNKPKRDVTKNKDNIIVTQTNRDRQEADVVGSDSEQSKSEVQSAKAIDHTHDFKIIEQESQGKIHSYAMEKSIIKDLRNDNQKDDISVIQETESVSQETIQNSQWIGDAELDLKEASFFKGFQETYIKLLAESKRILQANVCERHELQSLAQMFEKLYHEVTTFPCEDIYSYKKQMTTSLEDEHKLNTIHEKCLKTKTDLLLELQNLVLNIRNNCAIERAKSGIVSKGQSPGNAPKEINYLKSDKEPNNIQYSEANNIPPVNTEEKMHTSIKNDQCHLDFKEKLPVDLQMTDNSFFSYSKQYV